MPQEAILRRLRVTGLAVAVTIALAALVQGAALEWRFGVAPSQAHIVAASQRREVLASQILYDAGAATRERTAARSTDLLRATVALEAEQRNLADLQGDDARRFAEFIAAARALQKNPVDGQRLDRFETLYLTVDAAFQRATQAHLTAAQQSRAEIRDALIGASALVVVLILTLYFFVMRPRERAIESAIVEIEARRERFAAMFDNSSEMMAIYRLDGRVVRANRSAIDRLHFKPDTSGKHFTGHVADEARESAVRNFNLACTGRSVAFTSTFVTAEGEPVPVSVHLSPIIVRGDVVGVAGAANDITAQQRYEREIVRSRERFRSLFDRSPNAILAVDGEGVITDANRQLQQLTGYALDELVGRHLSMIVPPGMREAAKTRFSELIRGPARSYIAPTYTRDGHEIMLEVDATPIRVDGVVEGVFYTSRDMRRETAIRQQLEEKSERVRALLNIATLSWSGASRIDEALLMGSHALEMPYGYVISFNGDILTVRHRCGPDDFLPVGLAMPMTSSISERLLSSGRAIALEDLTVEPYASEMAARGLPWKSYIGTRMIIEEQLYGALVFLDTKVRAVPFDDADVAFIDIMSSLVGSAVAGELHRTELQSQATHDPLTGAANRAMLEEEFPRIAARARRHNASIAVLYIDLDGFKPVNDRFGHDAGDEVLRDAARRFGHALRGEDVLARIGGDEFVIMQDVNSGRAEVAALVQRLKTSIAQPFVLSRGQTVSLTASVGCAMYPEDGESLGVLLKRADADMYQQKRTRTATKTG